MNRPTPGSCFTLCVLVPDDCILYYFGPLWQQRTKSDYIYITLYCIYIYIYKCLPFSGSLSDGLW